ncbi:MAG TPA: endolytic transglycosylase MltG [Candidatus Binatia bacterium]|nr:endolytic transglycosylase MltG [Candidatus Binatia bacterium]
MKAVRLGLAVLLLGTALVSGGLYVFMFHWRPDPRWYPVEVRVEQGDSLAAVARKLRERRLIGNQFLFSLWARLNRLEKKIHQGLYRFESPVTAHEILERLITGKGSFNTVTIPEGLTVTEIAELLDKMQIAKKEKFLAASEDPSLSAALGFGAKNLEGYLFPSTYHFTPATPEREIIITMADQFRKVSWPLLQQRDDVSALTAHEVLTLASIIEKETGIEAERPLISAVFHNRLKRQMPLQSDPTVIYGIKDFNGNLTRKNLQDTTPYNTYRIAALPPGPICNPGLSSIRAALQPAPVPYLYFVSKKDGTHVFSENIEAHNQAVKTYHAPPSARGKATARR